MAPQAEKLDQNAIDMALHTLDGWHISDDGIGLEKAFRFSDFNAAFGFMTRVALAADKADHHPEWSNVYNKVHLRWTTHSEGGISTLDVKLATMCNAFANSVSLK
ncbi:4a-hydroxytetrahydrobiopterin dehydratase [Alphaproteobacteria bacterium]|nr:4a-hydroxytetrahydrobiopterin dehydratase [Alphaproteobacteria bacterium]